MSEKRFVYHEEYFPLNVREIIDNEIGEAYDCEDATDVLNELFDENEQLKEENEKLIQKNCIPCELVRLQTREIDKLKKENEQLKNDDLLFFQQVFNILMKYQHLFNREMADDVLEDLGIELTEWFE